MGSAYCDYNAQHTRVPTCVRSLPVFDALHCTALRSTAQALQKLSADHALPILHCRGLSAVLMFLDFFSTGIQRIAVAR